MKCVLHKSLPSGRRFSNEFKPAKPANSIYLITLYWKSAVSSAAGYPVPTIVG